MAPATIAEGPKVEARTQYCVRTFGYADRKYFAWSRSGLTAVSARQDLGSKGMPSKSSEGSFPAGYNKIKAEN